MISKCPGCGRNTVSNSFCANCEPMVQEQGIDDQQFMQSLPAEEQLVKNLPTAEAIAAAMEEKRCSKILIALYHRPAIVSRPVPALQVR